MNYATYSDRVAAMCAGELDDQRVRCIDCGRQKNYVLKSRERTVAGLWVDRERDTLRCTGEPGGLPDPHILRNCEHWIAMV